MLRKKYYNLSFVIIIVMFFNWVLTVFLPYNGITLLPYDNLKSEKRLFFMICVNTENGIKYRMVIGLVSRKAAYCP